MPDFNGYEEIPARESFIFLSSILKTGSSQSIRNREIGEISIDKGFTGKNGYGLLHVIEGRYIKDKFNENEITALLYKVKDSAEYGFNTNSIAIKKKSGEERIGIEKDGIIAIVSRRKETGKNFIITGYEINNKKEEAAEAIQTVIANYSRTPEFSDFRKQVGAAVSSLQQVSLQSSNKSRRNAIKLNENNEHRYFVALHKPEFRQQAIGRVKEYGSEKRNQRQIDQQIQKNIEKKANENTAIKAAKKAGYVQGVCECVAAIGGDKALGKKLLAEMKVTKDMAKKYANPETYKTLENGIFAQKQEHKHEQAQGVKR